MHRFASVRITKIRGMVKYVRRNDAGTAWTSYGGNMPHALVVEILSPPSANDDSYDLTPELPDSFWGS